MMNIMLALNDSIVSGALCVITSTMKYNKNVNWYILTMDIEVDVPEEGQRKYRSIQSYQRKLIRRIVKYFDSNSNVRFINTRDLYDKYLSYSPNHISGFTPYASLRLIADKILPHVNDLLYLDCDTIVCGDLNSYYNNYCNADANYSAYTLPDALDWRGEMVSGVLFFNMNKCRQTGFFEIARSNYCNNQYLYPDQMAIRDTCDPLDIGEELNYMQDLSKSMTSPVIIHFSGYLVDDKIYYTQWMLFFKKFPQFKYIDDYIQLIQELPYMSCDNYDDYIDCT